MEIERKFLIDGFPDLPPLRESVVYQGYLSTEPVVRIRSSQTGDEIRFVLCIKGKGTLAREEIELGLEAETFLRLRGLLTLPMIRKDYKTYALPGGLTLECSLVDAGEPTAFYYAEVEFCSVEEALCFVPPAFLGREVTEEPGWGMGHYWWKRALPAKNAAGVKKAD